MGWGPAGVVRQLSSDRLRGQVGCRRGWQAQGAASTISRLRLALADSLYYLATVIELVPDDGRRPSSRSLTDRSRYNEDQADRASGSSQAGFHHQPRNRPE